MTLEEYYKHYLSLHQNNWCRRLHVLGQLMTILFIATVIAKGYYLLLFLSPFVVYPFAWSGHYFFEKNQPAAFTHPIWAKVCDWMMLRDIIKGKIKW